MENNGAKNIKKELTVADLWNIFKRNIMRLTVIAVIGATVTGAAGAAFAILNRAYGATLSFSVSHSDPTNALLYNLQSEYFAEKLLLDENGLPPRQECDAGDYEAAVAAAREFDRLREYKKELKQKISRLQTSVLEYKKTHYDQEYNKIFEQLRVYKGAPSDVIASDEQHRQMIAFLEAQLSQITAERAEFMEQEYNPAILKKTEYNQEYSLISVEVNEARRKVEALAEKVVAPWREKEDVQKKVSAIIESVSYEYAKLEMPTDSGTSDEEQNKGYIKIYIETKNNKEFAGFIIDRLKLRTGDFVQKHVEKMTAVARVECTLISTFSSVEETGDGVFIGTVKFAAIGGAAVFVLTYMALIFKELIALCEVDGEGEVRNKKAHSQKTDCE